MWFSLFILWSFVPFLKAWGPPLSPLRTMLSLHALSSTVFRQVKDEIFQKQLDILTSPNSFYEKMFGLFTTTPFVHFSLHNIVTKEHIFYVCLFISSWIGYEYYNSPKYSMYKLNEFFEYKELKQKIRILLLMLVIIFFRDIENAI
jgi:hypothetical protein